MFYHTRMSEVGERGTAERAIWNGVAVGCLVGFMSYFWFVGHDGEPGVGALGVAVLVALFFIAFLPADSAAFVSVDPSDVANIRHDPETAALERITSEVVDLTTSAWRSGHAPTVLQLSNRDARLRHLAFCLGTVFYLTENCMTDPDTALLCAQYNLIEVAERSLDAQAVRQMVMSLNRAVGYVSGFWSVYDRAVESQNQELRASAGEATDLIVRVLNWVEIGEAMTNDRVRLRPLATWLEDHLSQIRSRFPTLVREFTSSSLRS
jgi:hypothetical protein